MKFIFFTFVKDWEKLENFTGTKLPSCVKIILRATGYDCQLSYENMNENTVFQLEDHVNKYLRSVVREIKCSHTKIYSTFMMDTFHFLPGNRVLILNLKEYFFLLNTSLKTTPLMKSVEGSVVPPLSIFEAILEEIENSPAFSNVLKEIIRSAVEIYAKTPNLYRYSEFIQYFSLYLFLLCGRRGYELLCSNLPLPSTSTICKSNLFFFEFRICFKPFVNFSEVYSTLQIENHRGPT